MIIWSGFGFLVAVIVFGMSLIFNLAFNALKGPAYYDVHRWPMALSLIPSAGVCWWLGSRLRLRQAQVVVDKQTGKELIIESGHHSLFFIPVRFGAPILAVLAVVLLLLDFAK